MKRIAILGSTGSIGVSALKVIGQQPEYFKAQSLCANANIDLLQRQYGRFRPENICVRDENAAAALRARLGKKVRILSGAIAVSSPCADKDVDHVLIAISGSAALEPLLCAIAHKKEVSLANKEALVMAGNIVMEQAANKKVTIIPIDSEQSAIWQCLEGQDRTKIETIYLTASGGPFRDWKASRFKTITVEKALQHPRWKMGKKITVDSATLMNKGLEVIEAMHLFGVSAEKIKVVIHPESIIHSMVEFVDGSILAQMSITDMRIPIQYALSYPNRLPGSMGTIDFGRLKRLSFEAPDFKKFPCLELAFLAARAGGTMPCVLNAANEVCVDLFLNRKIPFVSIARIIGKVMNKHRVVKNPDIGVVENIDNWARRQVMRLLFGDANG
jgi:1-deoxy-D-xylulose-5-phosphate reductoisomerase